MKVYMEHEPSQDYIVDAFQRYSFLGRPSYEEAEARIWQEALNKYPNLDEDGDKIKAYVKEHKGKLDDIYAVVRMLKILRKEDKDYIIQAVKNVYFYAPKKELNRETIINRVASYSLECQASEKTVYNWLHEARILCAKERGLSVSSF